MRLAGGDARRALTALEAAAGVAEDAIARRRRPRRMPCRSPWRSASRPWPTPRCATTATGDQHYDVAQRLHQVDARLRRRRRAALPRPHARGGRGPALHRPPDGHRGLRGRRHGRPDRPADRRRRDARRGSRSACPRRGSSSPRRSCTYALAPKSNAAYTGINAAIADVRAGKGGPVPAHLRDSGYAGRRPPRARQGLRLRPRRAGWRRRPAVPARRPGRADRLLPPDRPGLRGARLQERWTWLDRADLRPSRATAEPGERGPSRGRTERARTVGSCRRWTVTLGGIAGLIAALAFLFLVLRLGGLLGKPARSSTRRRVSLRTTSDNVQPTLKGLTDTVSLDQRPARPGSTRSPARSPR